jgi:glycogen synthase
MSRQRRRAQFRVLRLTSVFEPDSAVMDARAARFDPIGGMQNHTAALSRCLDALGVRQTVLTGRLCGPAGTSRLGSRGIVRRVGVPLRIWRQLWGACALPYVVPLRRRVSLVHAHQGEDMATLLLAVLAKALHRCPLVVTVHCSVRHTVKGRSLRCWMLRTLGGVIERCALLSADAVVTLVPRTADRIIADGVRPERLHVVPSGYEPALFADSHEDALPELPRPRIGYVGRLAVQKRPDLLLAAFERMRTSAHLVIVGDGPLRAEVEAAIRRSAARDRITMLGFVPHEQVPGILSSLDILALPSAYEEMGSVLVEAMAAALPVVASRVGGIPDVVSSGETGILVQPEDADALAAAFDSLVAEPQERQRLGAAAQRRVASYAWPDLAQRLMKLYFATTAASAE